MTRDEERRTIGLLLPFEDNGGGIAKAASNTFYNPWLSKIKVEAADKILSSQLADNDKLINNKFASGL